MSPEFGGFYVPDVMVYRHSDGREIKPFRTAMVYAAPSALASSALSDEQLQQYLACMNEKILNVLRMCSFKGHDEIVLGAWGCDGAIPCAYAEGIAHIFQNALCEHSFRRVTFAVSRASPETRDMFRRVFDNIVLID